MIDPKRVLTFLTVYTPRFLCVPCLALLMWREESELAPVVEQQTRDGTIETRTEGETCLNCAKAAFVVRVKENWRPL